MSWVRVKDKKEGAENSDPSDLNSKEIRSKEKEKESNAAQPKTPKLKFSGRTNGFQSHPSRNHDYNSWKPHKRPHYGYQSTAKRAYGNQTTAKRIRVHNSEADDPVASPTHSNDTPQQQSTLTKFAYRSVFPKDGRPRQTRALQSTSLVRVTNDDAPICPSIVRGVKCANVKCKKRHDVARSAAMPDCSFFQKGGMCFKETCAYRHVKVNENAEVCADFAKKGFCDDESCVLRHVKKIHEI